MMRRLWVFGLAVLIAAVCSAKETGSAAKARVEESVQAVLRILADKESEVADRRERVMEVISPVFDFELMAKLTVGKTQWKRFTEAQRKEFVDLFTQKLRTVYLDKLELFTDETVVTGEPVVSKSGKVQVPTHVISKGDRISILYKLYRTKDAGWRVYDMEILDVSIVSSYRSEYIPILRAGEPEGLFAKIRESLAAGTKGE